MRQTRNVRAEVQAVDSETRGRTLELPAGWAADGERRRRGGQATALYIRDGSGREGVYRQLKRPVIPKARERFRREVGILSGGAVQHRSVVRLLEWDADTERPWYISERGDPFIEWWLNWRHGHAEAVATKAVEVVRQLGAALAACHVQGVVHRDVKPTNLVVKRGEENPWPILIDFGLAYEGDAPRLTDPREAIGNRRFSPDPVRSRMEDVPAWLDVFALAQLLIWMLDEQMSDRTSWLRPLHWRYAKYDPGLGKDTLLAIHSFTAACAFESGAPSNGTECVELLDRLFPRTIPRRSGGYSTNQMEELRRGRRRGTAAKKLAEAEISEEVESSVGLAEVTYRSLRERILSVVEEIRNSGESVRVTVDKEFSFVLTRESTRTTDRPETGAMTLLWLHIGPPDVDIQLRVKVKVIPASTPPPAIASNVQYWRKHLPDDAICFGFAIEGGIPATSTTTYLDGRWISIGRSGRIYMHQLMASIGPHDAHQGDVDGDLGGSVEGPGKSSSIQDVEAYVMSVLTNPNYWEYITATSEDG